MNKKAIVSVFEVAFMILLISSSLVYIGMVRQADAPNYAATVESFADAMYHSEEYRITFMNESLSSPTPTEEWNDLEILLNRTFTSYEIILLNSTTQKTIYTCTPRTGKVVTEKIFFMGINNTHFEFRTLRFGVCY